MHKLTHLWPLTSFLSSISAPTDTLGPRQRSASIRTRSYTSASCALFRLNISYTRDRMSSYPINIITITSVLSFTHRLMHQYVSPLCLPTMHTVLIRWTMQILSSRSRTQMTMHLRYCCPYRSNELAICCIVPKATARQPEQTNHRHQCCVQSLMTTTVH